jgi:hypothetical protein
LASIAKETEQFQRSASKLLSSELDTLLMSGSSTSGVFLPIQTPSSSSSSQTFSNDPINLALSYVLRFSSGIDANLSAVTKNLQRRSGGGSGQFNVPIPIVTESRWSEIWNDIDSDNEYKTIPTDSSLWTIETKIDKVPNNAFDAFEAQ